jgi:hypothetical protein
VAHSPGHRCAARLAGVGLAEDLGLIPAAVASLVGGVVNAWLFLVRLTSEA